MTIAAAIFAALITGIVVNAILFQKGRHPSPLFGTMAAPPLPAPVPPPRPVALQLPETSPPVAQPEPVLPAPPPAHAAVDHPVYAKATKGGTPAKQVKAEPAKQAKADPLRALIRETAAPASGHSAEKPKSTPAKVHTAGAGAGASRTSAHGEGVEKAVASRPVPAQQ
jgi:hypothetical protein